LAELGISFTCGQERIQAGTAPVTLLSELDSLTLREIELEENTIRVDLSWAERAAAIAALDELRKEQHPGHNTSDTAREVFGYTGSGAAVVRESIELTKAIEQHPELAKAASHKDAVKMLKKTKEAAHRQTLAASADVSLSRHSILSGDSTVLLSTLPTSAAFNCIITDPPYGVNADDFGPQAVQAHAYRDTIEYALDCYHILAREGFRITAEQAHLYTFCSIENFQLLAEIFEEAGWSVWPRPLIWYKGNVGMLAKPDFGPRYTYEAILFASKGNKPVVQVGQHDVILVPSATDKVHAAEKPVKLYENLLARSCYPGDKILDPFAGSGVVFEAAESLRLAATGIELNETFVAECKLRISGV